MGAGGRLAVVAAVMRAAGLSGRDVVENREAWVKRQKIVFLLAEAGVVKELGGYSFSLYIHGPYSPALADDYYRIARGEVAVEPARLSAQVERLVRRLSEEPVEVLEVAATIADIVASHLEAGLLSGGEPEALLEGRRLPRRVGLHLRAVKPWAGAGVVERALRLLAETGLLRRLARRVRASDGARRGFLIDAVVLLGALCERGRFHGYARCVVERAMQAGIRLYVLPHVAGEALLKLENEELRGRGCLSFDLDTLNRRFGFPPARL